MNGNPAKLRSVSPSGRVPIFATTHWSVVLAAKERGSPDGAEALAELCRVYWYPLYTFVRRRGYDPHEGQDLTQEFFARLIEKEFLRLVDPGSGRFRSFLVMALDRFLKKEWTRANRQKRGGGQTLISFDAEAVERRYHAELADGIIPEKLFERRWALTLLDRAMNRLRRECDGPNKRALFDRIQGLLAGDRAEGSYETLAAEGGMTVGAFKVAVHRMRQRFRELLRAEVAQTVSKPEEIDEEIRYLLRALLP
jgi:RNA polymerase sigma-70 factor (ECF subfamily)